MENTDERQAWSCYSLRRLDGTFSGYRCRLRYNCRDAWIPSTCLIKIGIYAYEKYRRGRKFKIEGLRLRSSDDNPRLDSLAIPKIANTPHQLRRDVKSRAAVDRTKPKVIPEIADIPSENQEDEDQILPGLIPDDWIPPEIPDDDKILSKK